MHPTPLLKRKLSRLLVVCMGAISAIGYAESSVLSYSPLEHESRYYISRSSATLEDSSSRMPPQRFSTEVEFSQFIGSGWDGICRTGIMVEAVRLKEDSNNFGYDSSTDRPYTGRAQEESMIPEIKLYHRNCGALLDSTGALVDLLNGHRLLWDGVTEGEFTHMLERHGLVHGRNGYLTSLPPIEAEVGQSWQQTTPFPDGPGLQEDSLFMMDELIQIEAISADTIKLSKRGSLSEDCRSAFFQFIPQSRGEGVQLVVDTFGDIVLDRETGAILSASQEWIFNLTVTVDNSLIHQESKQIQRSLERL